MFEGPESHPKTPLCILMHSLLHFKITVVTPTDHTRQQWLSRSRIPKLKKNKQFFDPGRTDRIQNLHYLCFIYYLIFDDVLLDSLRRICP